MQFLCSLCAYVVKNHAKIIDRITLQPLSTGHPEFSRPFEELSPAEKFAKLGNEAKTDVKAITGGRRRA
jgi:hypothetical protein